MKKGGLIFLLFFVVPLINASTLTLEKDNYLSGETVTAHLLTDSNFTYEFSQKDIFLKKDNTEISIVPILIKKDSSNYYFYFNIPQSVSSGVHEIGVKLVYLDNKVLKSTDVSEEISIIKVNPLFSDLVSSQSIDGSFNSDFKTTAYAALALKNVYPENAKNAANWISNKQDSSGCFPRLNCDTVSTALGYRVLSDFGFDSTKSKNWLDNSKNDITPGKFTLILDGGSGSCTINNEEVSWPYGAEDFTKEIFDNVNVACDSSVETSVTYSYLGKDYKNLYEKSGENVLIEIGQGGCFGTGFKNSCDQEATALASFLLDEKSDWLKNNFDDKSTLSAIVLKKHFSDEYYTNWLKANKLEDGSYPTVSNIAISNPKLTAMAYSTTKEKDTLNWLNTFDGTALENSQVLFFAFSDQKKEHSISAYPAVILNKLGFNLVIANKDPTPVRVDITNPNNHVTVSKDSFLLNNKETIDIKLSEPKDATLTLNYQNRSLDILIFFTESDIKEISDIKISLEDNLQTENITLFEEESKKGVLTLIGPDSDTPLSLSADFSGSISKIITIEENKFNLSKGDRYDLVLEINSDKSASGFYNGELIIKDDKTIYLEVPISVNFVKKDSEVVIEEPPVEEEPKNESEPEEIPEEKEEKSNFWIWLIIIPTILIIIVLVIFFLKKRMQKDQVSESDKKILKILDRYD